MAKERKGDYSIITWLVQEIDKRGSNQRPYKSVKTVQQQLSDIQGAYDRRGDVRISKFLRNSKSGRDDILSKYDTEIDDANSKFVKEINKEIEQAKNQIELDAAKRLVVKSDGEYIGDYEDSTYEDLLDKIESKRSELSKTTKADVRDIERRIERAKTADDLRRLDDLISEVDDRETRKELGRKQSERQGEIKETVVELGERKTKEIVNRIDRAKNISDLSGLEEEIKNETKTFDQEREALNALERKRRELESE